MSNGLDFLISSGPPKNERGQTRADFVDGEHLLAWNAAGEFLRKHPELWVLGMSWDYKSTFVHPTHVSILREELKCVLEATSGTWAEAESELREVIKLCDRAESLGLGIEISGP